MTEVVGIPARAKRSRAWSVNQVTEIATLGESHGVLQRREAQFDLLKRIPSTGPAHQIVDCGTLLRFERKKPSGLLSSAGLHR
jgi:hypothetical protein